jgi:type IV pilus assembly protein PilM
MAERLSMSMGDAEKLKCRVGLLPEHGPETAEVIQEAVRPFLNEVRSSIGYFTGQQPDRAVTRLALVGGAAQLPGLTEQLTSATRIPAFLADPLQHVEDSRKGGRHDVLGRFRSSAAVAIGLTLRAA